MRILALAMMFAAMANGVMSAKAGEPWIPLCCYDRKPPQLAFAHAVTTKAKARYFCFQNAMGSGVSDLAILDRTWLAQCSDLNNNPRIVKLRGEYLSLAVRAEIYSQKYGSEHLAVIALRKQMGELQLSIQDEMSRIEQNYKSDYEIALVGPVIDSAAIL